MRGMKLRVSALLMLTILSMTYYGICISYAYVGVSWLWIWPLFSLLCFIRAILLVLEGKGRLSYPKWLMRVYRAGVAVCISCFVLTEGCVISGMTEKPEEDLDYLIILGAGVRRGVPTSPLRLRIERAAEYLQQHPDVTAIASGGRGSGENISEAECIRRYLTEKGIPEDRILLEDRSSDTFENILNSFLLIGDGKKTGIVTNSFHIFRAKFIAKLMGHTVYGIPAKTLLPLGIHYTVREFFGVCELVLKVVHKPSAFPALFG